MVDFVTGGSAPVGTPLHVTVYDADGAHVQPSLVTWGPLAEGVTVTPDADGDGAGFVFNASALATFQVNASTIIGTATFNLSFTATPLFFSVP